ncbi:MAG: choice-of-anchor domain [Edaphobacter sp.]|nr:choice-of-anchor domain [Edaphobacter sp.]
MVVSHNHAVSPSSGHGMSTSTRSSNVESLKCSGIPVWPFSNFCLDKLFTSFLFALVSCVVVGTSGCGSGISKGITPAGIGTGTSSGAGVAPSPQLTVSTGTVGFRSVTVSTSTTQSVTLTSTGTSAVTVSSASISGTGFSVLEGSLPATLAPTQSLTLQVQFQPTVTGRVTGQLTVRSDSATNGTAVIGLSGAGVAAPSPQLTVSTASLSFGNTTVNSAAAQALTLTSSGTSAITVSAVAISGASFSIIGGGSLPVRLSPGQSLMLQVQFKPTVRGRVTGQLTVRSDSATNGTAVIGLSGAGVAAPSPQLTVSSGAIGFRSVTVNTSTTQSVTLTSTGTAAVTVSSASISGAGFSLVGGSFPATLAPTQSLTLQVQFKPTVTGRVTGQLTVRSDSATNGTAVIGLSGAGVAAPSPQLTVSRASLSFGNTTVNSAAAQSVTLTSTGTAAVTVSSASISGTGFSLVGGSLPVTLSPGQSLTLQVQFKPVATGSATGQLTVRSDSATNGTAVIGLSGAGVTAPSPQLTVNSGTVGFGSVTVNTSTTQTLTLTSSGTSVVTVSAVAISGASFSIIGGSSLPVTLSPGQSLTLQVQFKPMATGSATGQITITSDSASGSTTVVALSGTGTAVNPRLTINVTTLSFGNTAVNSAATQTLTLTSSGTSAVTVSAAAISGAGFSIIGGSFPVTLNPNQSLTLQVQFKPTTSGSATGQLTISSDSAPGSTTLISLSGTGTALPHEVDLSWNAPVSSPDPVAGYNIYRATAGGSFQLINTSVQVQITYVDSTVSSGATYNYVVKSIDSGGIESDPSNQFAVTIP